METTRYVSDETLMSRICDISIHWRKSPLCNNWELYNSWKRISQERWADRSIILWIMFAESHIWANFATTCNSSWNNWGWVKARVHNNGDVSWDQKIPNNWCYLYKFDNMNDYFESKANMIWVNYKWCFNRNSKRSQIECISFRYIWDPNVAEQHRINNVMSISY